MGHGTRRMLLLYGPWNKETASPAWSLKQGDCFSCMVPGTRRLLLLHGPWNKETDSPPRSIEQETESYAWSLEQGDCFSCMHGLWNKETASPAWSIEQETTSYAWVLEHVPGTRGLGTNSPAGPQNMRKHLLHECILLYRPQNTAAGIPWTETETLSSSGPWNTDIA
jgi:hypothetical protein